MNTYMLDYNRHTEQFITDVVKETVLSFANHASTFAQYLPNSVYSIYSINRNVNELIDRIERGAIASMSMNHENGISWDVHVGSWSEIPAPQGRFFPLVALREFGRMVCTVPLKDFVYMLRNEVARFEPEKELTEEQFMEILTV